jgi:integrase
MRELLDSWRLALDQEDKSPGTITSYLDTIAKAAAWLDAKGLPTGVDEVEPEHLRAYLAAEKERTSPGNAAKHYRNLSVFFGWCVAEQELTGPNPMDRVNKIPVKAKAVHIPTDDELQALLKTCSGSGFVDRRDNAIIRTLLDNGVRVSGLAGIRYTPDEEETHDVYLSRHVLRVKLKGGRWFWAPIGKKTAAAIDRYIRARRHHRQAASPWLWLPFDARSTRTGDCHLTASGIKQMLDRRCEEAKIRGYTPHDFRRWMASNWEGDALQLMRIGGWESIAMVQLYGRAREEERAREAHAKLAPGDRF